MKSLQTVPIRQNAVFIPANAITAEQAPFRQTTAVLVANLAQLGYGVSESLLKVLNLTTPAFQAELLEAMREITGIKKNWTPLVKGWDTPTNESWFNHLFTWVTNKYKQPGTKLQCGHTIPPNTFPLERYNGCPFCGTAFEAGVIEHYKQNSSQKVLELWRDEDLHTFFIDLLRSKTALDATQTDSLKLLLGMYEVPVDVQIGMKETLVCVIDFYREKNQPEKVQAMFSTPADILRYLWYKHTGFLQIIEPKTIIHRARKNNVHVTAALDESAAAKLKAKASLKLKYSRRDCLIVASWLNGLNMDAAKACEIMHPKRGMWVRFIRALRLAEYSKRKGFEKLAELLDVFYKEEYDVWQGRVDHFRLRYDSASTFCLLKQRPGLFARSLFSNMLWFGAEETVTAFVEVIDKVPARLVFTLAMHADSYFDKTNSRSVKPLGGGAVKKIAANHLLSVYEGNQLMDMRKAVERLCRIVLEHRFASRKTDAKTMFIDKALYSMPLAIGDRSETVQDIPAALPGSRFAVEGSKVRLFMQWGAGLPAQHLDMDLSCTIIYKNFVQSCAFNSLNVPGCKHSGDMRSIPAQVGTAEYIEIDLEELRVKGAQQVIFTCNAYRSASGAITPNLVVGWMNSRFPMMISEKTGVAYDPSCVQHQVRIINRLAKGLAFGSLDVAAGEITWLEMPFDGQTVASLNKAALNALLNKLAKKMSIGEALEIKAKAQGLQLVPDEQADEVYSKKWALNTAGVMNLLMD
ncbi:MAG: hypothetical protein DI535_13065 [Citrobacter freundii]|nr:MAG: hypothetical protein DI535_13065 [Citrobacter freundii]